MQGAIEIRSTHFTTADGLANNTVRSMLQDNKGFIWLCTENGLSRYDGNSFVNYRPIEGVPSLPDCRVRKLQEDSEGRLWIDVISERQCCYDLKSGQFVDFTGCGEYNQTYSGTLQVSNGDIWMWHELNGCRQIRREKGEFSSVTFRKEDGNISSSKANRIWEDEKGRIWILTDKGAHQVKGDKAELTLETLAPIGILSEKHTFFLSKDGHLFTEKEGGFVEVATLPGSPNITDALLLNDSLYIFTSTGGLLYRADTGELARAGELDIPNGEVQKDNKGNYWVYNHTGTVHYIHAETHAIKRFNLFTKEQLSYIDYERYHFVHDSRNIIWISTYGNGLFAYNLSTGELQHFQATTNKNSNIPSNYLLNVQEDRSGGIWVCSEFSGISRITVLNEGTEYIFPEGISDVDDRSNLIRMLINLDGQIYVGTRQGGVYIYDNRLRLLKKEQYDSNIYAVAKDAEGNLWTGSRGGGLRIGGVWYRHQEGEPTSLASNHVFCIHKDRKGRMWVGTFHGGLDLATKGKDGTYTFRHFFNQTYNQRQVRAISEDRNGYLWVGTSDGIYLFQPDSLLTDTTSFRMFNSQNSLLRSSQVKSLCPDSKGRMWIATSGSGLYLCRPENDYDKLNFEQYDTSHGLVNDMVQAVVEDHQGRIWVTTEYGVSCLDADQNVFENHFFSSYISGNTYSDNSACVMPDGKVILGTRYGLAAISPDKVFHKNASAIPTVTLTELKINGIPVRPCEMDSPLKEAMPYVDCIELEYDQNSFEVDFSTFDYNQDGTMKYMCRLDNYDKAWSTPFALNFTAYKNLDPGEYLLHVKACNSFGVWGNRETTLRIIIHPPFWKSRWAYLLYAILVAAIIYVLFRLFHDFNALRNRIQVEKQLTEYKLVFFTNISHEFRTPLTLIQGALEKIEGCTNPKEMAYSLKILNKSTQRMLRLINQLLEFRKMQNNKLALSLEETDVIAFLYEIFLSFKDAAESKKMDFRFTSSMESYRMFIDKGNLDKVSYNLLSNAFKYTPCGGRILFSVTADAERRRLVISVADTGVGIPKEKQQELFKRFMQSSFSGNSIGVGLHLTHELVSVHKGTITYSENEGGGSVFTVMLPTDTAVYEEKDFLIPNQLLVEGAQPHKKEEANESANQEEELQELPPTPLNKRKILIIEDDDDVREFLKKEIDHYFEVETETDGTAGLERARTYDADLIVCDVLMPGISGFEVTRRLKNNFDTSHIPIILLTALSTEDKQLEGVQSGADAYIVKPFSPKLLLARIFKLIEQREKLREKFTNDPNMVRPAICASQQDKEFADRLQAVMEKQIGNAQFTIDEFAELMRLGRTIFYRKVRGVTGYTPNEYMRVMRMKRAAELLADGTNNVSEVAYAVGINDPFYFSKCFKQQFGVSPTAYRKGERAEQTEK